MNAEVEGIVVVEDPQLRHLGCALSFVRVQLKKVGHRRHCCPRIFVQSSTENDFAYSSHRLQGSCVFAGIRLDILLDEPGSEDQTNRSVWEEHVGLKDT